METLRLPNLTGTTQSVSHWGTCLAQSCSVPRQLNQTNSTVPNSKNKNLLISPASQPKNLTTIRTYLLLESS